MYGFSFFMFLITAVKRKLDRYTASIVFVALLMFIGLRYASVDYFGYWEIYDSIRSYGLLGFSKEPGFAFLNIIEQKITGHFFYFIFFFSLASLFIKFAAFKKIKICLTLALFVYLSTALFWKDLGQIRNGFVAGLMLFAVVFSYHKQFKKYFLVILLGFFIHSSAVIGLLIYYVDRIANRTLMFSILIFGFLIGASGGIAHLLLGYIPIDALGSLSARAHSYVDGDYDLEKNIFGLASLANMVFMFFVVFYYHRLKEVLPINVYFIPLAVVSLSLENALTDFGIIGSRISDLLFFPSIIVILSSFYSVKGQDRSLFIAVIFVYCFVRFAHAVSSAYPYQSILQFL